MTKVRTVIYALAISFVFSFSVFSAEREGKIFIITHPSLSGKVNVGQLRLIYSMRKRSIDGVDLRVVSFKDKDQVFISFSTSCLKLSPRVFQRLWQRNLFTGAGWVPVFVSSSKEMLEYVRRNPGAIGYVYESEFRKYPKSELLNRIECRS